MNHNYFDMITSIISWNKMLNMINFLMLYPSFWGTYWRFNNVCGLKCTCCSNILKNITFISSTFQDKVHVCNYVRLKMEKLIAFLIQILVIQCIFTTLTLCISSNQNGKHRIRENQKYIVNTAYKIIYSDFLCYDAIFKK